MVKTKVIAASAGMILAAAAFAPNLRSAGPLSKQPPPTIEVQVPQGSKTDIPTTQWDGKTPTIIINANGCGVVITIGGNSHPTIHCPQIGTGENSGKEPQKRGN